MKKDFIIIKYLGISLFIFFFTLILVTKFSCGSEISSGNSDNNITTIKICAGCGDSNENNINNINEPEQQKIARAKIQIIVVFLFLLLFIFLMTRPSTKIQHMIEEIDESIKKL